MGIVIKYDYADDIKNRRFGRIAELVLEGDISALDQTSRELLANFLRGDLKRSAGAPRKDLSTLAEYLHGEYQSLRSYGMTGEEIRKYFEENATPENYKNILSPNNFNGMKRKQAIEVVADKECMGFKNVERLIDAWAKYERRRDEMYPDI